MTSTRLPGKVAMPLGGVPILLRVLERLRRVEAIDAICVATPEGAAHDPIEAMVNTIDYATLVRGPEDDVLHRFVIAAEATKAETIVRVTSDCPFVDPQVTASVVAAFEAAQVPYARTAIETGFPLGFDTEVMSREALDTAHREATDPYEREHVTPFIWRDPGRFPALEVGFWPDLRHWRLVVDTPEDYQLASTLYDLMAEHNRPIDFPNLRSVLDQRPDLLAINADVPGPPYIGLPR